jgi:hypothetical protein
MKKILTCLAAATMMIGGANASVIAEIEPNSTLGTAQNVENAFSTGANADILNSNLVTWEWASIESLEGDRTYDYFRFNAQTGQNYIFDVDFGMHDLDPEIGLWSLDGSSSNLLHQQDDGCQALGLDICGLPGSGSSHNWDPIFSWQADQTSTYIVGIARFDSSANDGGFTGDAPKRRDNYTLQIAREVPEPVTLGLLGLGLCLLVRRKK